jgi:nitroreductase
MELFEAISTQRAIRRLKPDPVPDSIIRQILAQAICAPSGGNRQLWSFVVVRDAATRARLGELYRESWGEVMKLPYYAGAAKEPPSSPAGKLVASASYLSEHLGEAPVLILACIALDTATSATLTTGASIYPAVQNLMLAARALGVGSCLTTIHKFRDREVKELVGIPANVETAALIPLGYPRGKFTPARRKPVTDVTYADRWGRALA